MRNIILRMHEYMSVHYYCQLGTTNEAPVCVHVCVCVCVCVCVYVHSFYILHKEKKTGPVNS